MTITHVDKRLEVKILDYRCDMPIHLPGEGRIFRKGMRPLDLKLSVDESGLIAADSRVPLKVLDELRKLYS
jgi:hypothetical protein